MGDSLLSGNMQDEAIHLTVLKSGASRQQAPQKRVFNEPGMRRSPLKARQRSIRRPLMPINDNLPRNSTLKSKALTHHPIPEAAKATDEESSDMLLGLVFSIPTAFGLYECRSYPTPGI